jgi:hypothetical protein
VSLRLLAQSSIINPLGEPLPCYRMSIEEIHKMSKRFGFVLVALVVLSALLTACSAESRDTAEDYMNALLKGETDKAVELACESFKDETAALADSYAAQGILADEIDLKFDVGKGQNNEEIIVTGAYQYGDEADPTEFELTEHDGTRIVLWLEESDGDWCVTDESEFGTLEVSAPEATEEAAPEATEEPAPTATEAAE